MNVPTLAMWLQGPIGAGVLGGVLVLTLGMTIPPGDEAAVQWAFRPLSSVSTLLRSKRRRAPKGSHQHVESRPAHTDGRFPGWSTRGRPEGVQRPIAPGPLPGGPGRCRGPVGRGTPT